MDAETSKGKAIVVYGVKQVSKGYNKETCKWETEDKMFSKTFKVGDLAEYDSYNYSYVGKIKQITDKTVTIIKDYRNGQSETKRLKIRDFAWRNYNFDLERINQERHDHLHYN